MGRPCHCRRIQKRPVNSAFYPEASDAEEAVILPHDCCEAMRLADLEGLTASEAAERMGISRHTFGRLLKRGRHQAAKAIYNLLPLLLEGGQCVSYDSCTGERIMSESILVAVPSEAPGGLEAAPSAHFGHCACYTVAKVADGKVSDVTIVQNKGHEHGGCVQPVTELAAQGVKALLAGGMGMKPLTAMQQAGIEVFYCVGQLTVGDALRAFADGKLQPFGSEQLCTGCHGHH